MLKEILAAQTRLLSRHSANFAKWESLPSSHGINSIHLRGSSSSSSAPPILVLHGYGSGLGMFFANIRDLEATGRSIYLLDWPGFGGSDRTRKPPLRRSLMNCSKAARDRQDDAVAVETINFFIDPLSAWLREHNVGGGGPINVVAHSMGGYFAAKFAQREPARINKLVLASPVGLHSRLEFDIPPASSSRSPTPTVSPGGASSPPGAPRTPPLATRPPPPSFSRTKLLDLLYAANITPQHLFRALMSKERSAAIVRSRFSRSAAFGEVDWEAVADYLWHITKAPASGEYALNNLFHPPFQHRDVVARLPVVRDRPHVVERLKERTTVVYGSHDWVRNPDSMAAARKIASKVIVLPEAGHHLYLDAARPFGELCV